MPLHPIRMNSMNELQELSKDLFKLTIPLPNSPLKSINSYLIKDEQRLLVIDVGFNHPQCYQVLTEAIYELGYTLDQICVLLTHSHPDHAGNLENFNLDTLPLYAPMASFNEVHAFYQEQEPVYGTYMNPLVTKAHKQPTLDARGLKHYLSQELLPLSKNPNIRLLKHGSHFSWGAYTFEVLHCPGHDKWHLCLWEINKHFLIAGDVILERMSPAIVSWSLNFNALAQFLESLTLLKKLPISFVLPAHGGVIENAHDRIDQLIEHHQQRLDEIEVLVAAGHTDLPSIARACTWKYNNWDSWEIDQKYFALGETLAHLIYLAYNERITLVQEDLYFYAFPAKRETSTHDN